MLDLHAHALLALLEQDGLVAELAQPTTLSGLSSSEASEPATASEPCRDRS